MGTEWSALGPLAILQFTWTTWVAFAGCVGVAIWRRTKPSADTIAHLLIALLWFFATLKAIKFVEYLVPFLLIAGGLLVRDSNPKRQSKWIWPITLLVGGFALWVANYNHVLLEARPTPYRYQKGMEGLCKNATEGEIVVHTAWGDFAELMAWCPKLRYMSGLDPSFMYLSHPEEFLLLQQARYGEIKLPSQDLLDKVGGQWLFVNHVNQPDLMQYAYTDKGLQKRYIDQSIAIFWRIPPATNEQPSGTPSDTPR